MYFDRYVFHIYVLYVYVRKRLHQFISCILWGQKKSFSFCFEITRERSFDIFVVLTCTEYFYSKLPYLNITMQIITNIKRPFSYYFNQLSLLHFHFLIYSIYFNEKDGTFVLNKWLFLEIFFWTPFQLSLCLLRLQTGLTLNSSVF